MDEIVSKLRDAIYEVTRDDGSMDTDWDRAGNLANAIRDLIRAEIASAAPTDNSN